MSRCGCETPACSCLFSDSSTVEWSGAGSAGDPFVATVPDGVFVPIGGIIEWGTNTAPTNWLLLDGSAVSRTTYAALFALWGTTYGAGDGSTTFNVMNKKGRVGVGRDAAQTEFDVLGEVGGAKTHVLDVTELPGQGLGTVYTAGGSPLATWNYTIVAAAGHNNLQPYIVVNYIVRAL